MKIKEVKIKVKDLVSGYTNNDEDGVTGFHGTLDIRPPYQREFVYKEKQRNAVISSINSGYPLNTMYWSVRDDGTFEVLDGQQRTLSICDYVEGNYSIDFKYFHNLTEEEKDVILDYELSIYQCSGTDAEKLHWFNVINTVGEKLTAQELRNAVYTGAWLADVKRFFSKTNCTAYKLGKKYMRGTPIRQDYLETVLKWISDGDIEGYMANHQQDSDGKELKIYFKSLIAWVEETFTTYRKEMKSVDWGELYNTYKDTKIDDVNTLESEIKDLMLDDDVTKKSGIYDYILSGNERVLSIRKFTDKQKREAYEAQNGICLKCKDTFTIDEMEADHITPWSKGGKTTADNCQLLCKKCNRTKSDV